MIAITYGTFDLFHVGHVNLLERIKSKCDYLIVAVSTDEFNLSKGKRSVFPFEQRMKIVQSLRCVDMTIPESSWDQKVEDIQKYKVDKFVMGDDWAGKFDFLKNYCEVEYLERTKDISTTDVKHIISSISKEKIQDLKKVIEIIEGFIGSVS